MSSAQVQAFALPEILESILLHLPTRDLLVNAQLVCHSWNEVIQCRTLQQALFFEPIPASSIQELNFNPLLQEVFFPWFDPRQQANRYSRGAEIKALEWNSSDKKKSAYRRKRASWRRMLPIQPPATIFEVDFYSMAMAGSKRKKGEIPFADGVRMGTLYDYVYKRISRPISSFWVEWKMFPSVSTDTSAEEVPWTPNPKVTMHIRWTRQCSGGRPPDLGEIFRSEGFQDLEVVLKSP
jgi:hypothetical protein